MTLAVPVRENHKSKIRIKWMKQTNKQIKEDIFVVNCMISYNQMHVIHSFQIYI